MKRGILIALFSVTVILAVFIYYGLPENRGILNFMTQPKEELKQEENLVKTSTDYSICNENGEIMILMYHQFSDKKGDSWTRTFEDFKNDLKRLYEKNYRPISMTDYINGNIDIPYGTTPVILTFDDGSAGQLKFSRVDGELVADENTAVSILQKFNAQHPEFKLNGTFYISAANFFGGTGTFGQRLKYLTGLGFEIGNRTKSSYALGGAKTEEKVKEEVGGFAKFINEYLPGYTVNSLSLPGGSMTTKFATAVYSGTYEGFNYENKAIVSIYNSSPSKSPISKELNLMGLPRIKVGDEKKGLNYWLKYFDEHPEEKYISDGDAKVFRINNSDKEAVSYEKYKVTVK